MCSLLLPKSLCVGLSAWWGTSCSSFALQTEMNWSFFVFCFCLAIQSSQKICLFFVCVIFCVPYPIRMELKCSLRLLNLRYHRSQEPLDQFHIWIGPTVMSCDACQHILINPFVQESIVITDELFWDLLVLLFLRHDRQ